MFPTLDGTKEMSEKQKVIYKLEDLAGKALDGCVQTDELHALEELLAESEKAREKFLEFAAFECALEDAVKADVPARAVDCVSNDSVVVPRQTTKRSGGTWRSQGVPVLMVTAAVLVVLLVVLNRGLGPKQGGPGRSSTAPPNGFAVVASQADVDWETSAVSSGDVLPRGVHHIRSGVIQLELFSGVQLVVEGEAEFVIESPLVVSLSQGAVRAYVPDVAHGFRVVTEAGKIIDYGTEFSVRVNGDTTDVTVLDGEVGLVQEERPEVRFTRGESLRVRSTTAKHEVLNEPIHVMSSLTVSRAAQQSLYMQEEVWEKALEEWLRDPRLVACYRGPSEKQSRVLENLCDGAMPATQAAVVGATACINRWGREGQAFD